MEHQEETQITFSGIWSRIPLELKRQISTDFWSVKLSDAQSVMRFEIAKALSYREKFITQQSAEKKAEYLLTASRRGKLLPSSYEMLIREWLLGCQVDMLSAFLDTQEIPHENGIIPDGISPPSIELMRKGIDAVRSKYPMAHLAVYFEALQANDSEMWRELPLALGEDYGSFQSPLEEASDANESEPDGEDALDDDTSFTTLDRMLISAAVATAMDTDNSMKPDDLEHMIDEVLNMNIERQRSYFHKGYFDALMEREYNFDFAGANAKRREWYAYGVLMGLLRRDRPEELLKQLKSPSAIMRNLVGDSAPTPGGVMALPHVYPVLVDQKAFGLVNRWVPLAAKMNSRPLMGFLQSLLRDADSLIREGQAFEAEDLLRHALDLSTTRTQELEAGFMGYLLPRLVRTRALAERRLGNFAAAQKSLDSLKIELEGEEPPILGMMHSDRGLIAGGFRSLEDVLPLSGDELPAKRDALAKGLEHFSASIKNGQGTTESHFCIGISTLIAADVPHEAAESFNRALQGMNRDEEQYEQGGLIEWARMGLAVSLLSTMENGRFQEAVERISQVLQSDVGLPHWIWREALKYAAAFQDQSLALKITQHLLEEGDAGAMQIVINSGVHKSPSIRADVLRFLRDEPLKSAEKWDVCSSMLGADNTPEGMELDREILDLMEQTAHGHDDISEEFARFLCESKEWDPAWRGEEADACLIRLYEQTGQREQATVILKKIFYQIAGDFESRHLLELQGIRDKIHHWALNADVIESMDCCLAKCCEEAECDVSVEKRLKDGEAVHVLYVGGNETQQQYVEGIKSRLGSEYPGLTLSFILPGWSSNWNKDVEVFKSKLRSADCVVLNRLVRTQFGRTVRKLCGSDHPWLPCTGSGKKSLESAIVAAAHFHLGRV